MRKLLLVLLERPTVVATEYLLHVCHVILFVCYLISVCKELYMIVCVHAWSNLWCQLFDYVITSCFPHALQLLLLLECSTVQVHDLYGIGGGTQLGGGGVYDSYIVATAK